MSNELDTKIVALEFPDESDEPIEFAKKMLGVTNQLTELCRMVHLAMDHEAPMLLRHNNNPVAATFAMLAMSILKTEQSVAAWLAQRGITGAEQLKASRRSAIQNLLNSPESADMPEHVRNSLIEELTEDLTEGTDRTAEPLFFVPNDKGTVH